MLGKLLKYDFTSVSKILLPLHLILILFAVMGRILIAFGVGESAPLIAGFLLMFYILGIVAIGIVTIVVLVLKFYRNLFTSQGYLMNTLPVKPSSLILSKLTVAVTWSIIDCIFVLFSLFILVASQNVFNALYEGRAELAQVWDVMKFLFSGTTSTPLFIGALILFAILAMSYMYLSFYVSISVGQLMTKHKILGAFLTYVAIYLVVQFLSILVMIAAGYYSWSNNLFATMSVSATDPIEYLQPIYPTVLWISNALSALLAVIYYYVTKYMMTKKLNLD